MLGLDGARKRFNSWLRGLVSSNGRSFKRLGQSMARNSHDARRNGCERISLSQCG
jgi:hypothetical protein